MLHLEFIVKNKYFRFIIFAKKRMFFEISSRNEIAQRVF